MKKLVYCIAAVALCAPLLASAGEAFVVEHEGAVVAPFREQALFESCPLDLLEPIGRNDLIGVDVGAIERHRATADRTKERLVTT